MISTKYCSANEAVKSVKNGDYIFIHSVPMSPDFLLDALVERHKELKSVEFIQIVTSDEAKYTQFQDSFKVRSLFCGKNVRNTVNSKRGSYTPVFLSQMPKLFKEKYLKVDVALIQVSPPDKHGFCSMGMSVDVTKSAVEVAKIVIAQINPKVPRIFGDGYIHISDIDYAVEHETEIKEFPADTPSDRDILIGNHIAELIEDGANLQIGIGALPNAVMNNLKNHKNLGIHTELLTEGVLPLIKSGVINGKNKNIDREKIVATFSFGSRDLYDFLDNNPSVLFKPACYTNSPCIIGQNEKVVAINSAIEIDLTGQVCSDTIGKYQFSGVGGQLDFTLGAALSNEGKPIFGIASTTEKGISKIVPKLKDNASVTTTRAHVNWVVTEYGAVNLFGKSNKERAKALISIAHPSYRESLEKEAFELFKF